MSTAECIAGALLLAAFTTAFGQSGRAVKLVVPYPPGGNADTLARTLAEQITKSTVMGTLVENRPGGGNLIGQDAHLRKSHDDYARIIHDAGIEGE